MGRETPVGREKGNAKELNQVEWNVLTSQVSFLLSLLAPTCIIHGRHSCLGNQENAGMRHEVS